MNFDDFAYIWAGEGSELRFDNPVGFRGLPHPKGHDVFVFFDGNSQRQSWRLTIKTDDRYEDFYGFSTKESAYRFACQDSICRHRWSEARGFGEYVIDGLGVRAYVHQFNGKFFPVLESRPWQTQQCETLEEAESVITRLVALGG